MLAARGGDGGVYERLPNCARLLISRGSVERLEVHRGQFYRPCSRRMVLAGESRWHGGFSPAQSQRVERPVSLHARVPGSEAENRELNKMTSRLHQSCQLSIGRGNDRARARVGIENGIQSLRLRKRIPREPIGGRAHFFRSAT